MHLYLLDYIKLTVDTENSHVMFQSLPEVLKLLTT